MRTLRKGDKGDDVKTLQKLLGITDDGDFGKKTEAAVIAFQKAKGLTADGVVGAPSRFCYTIRSLKPGNTTLRFEYRRPWEKNPPLELHIYDISVETDGKLLIQERTED